MSREERTNPNVNKPTKSRPLSIKVTIPAIVVIAILSWWIKINKFPSVPPFDFRAYLECVDTGLTERIQQLPDSTSTEYLNIKLVLDYKRFTIDVLDNQYIKEHLKELQNDINRIAADNSVTLPSGCSPYSQ